ncbi:carbohydrate ABC transporter substrate-binding protein (CUT1 family) [Keratinibaculum paraultunense]|uniref:Carbohydrate ABC transporter substrate-binding protein (CUT1 family) n=1 Tax=Keratinibaculum paraultunense TaxID=1278232 RepID=A0A4R3KTX5_9FIRM|nr:extracellular solute-binding protein [Keratinibaculum paraultunense]QQY79105.1 extracellular solute-binding protein [Keratinibaculum paraultunense]TCS88487.1 carbohydrate ABC transporter substrate-binding protein (CUT1 family) [Keratinibaculum paraultunense]
MRRIVLFILVGFILVWTYNLFINNFIQLEKVEEEPYKGIIEIWDFSRKGSYKWLQNRIRTFEKQNPGVYIEIVSKDDNKDTMPDIIPVDLNFSNLDVLEPLDDYFENEELEEFKHQALVPVTYNKELKALPIAMTTSAIYINLDKFYERGVNPPIDGNWTYEEFVDALKQLTCDSNGDGVIDEYGFLTSIGENNYHIWGIILSDGAQFIEPKRLEYSFYGEKAIKGLERLMDLKYKHGIVPDYFGIIGEKDAWNMFFEDQRVAAFATGSWAIDVLEKSYREDNGFNFEVVNFPTGDKNLPVILSSDIISYGIIKDEDPKKMKMCVEFLKHLTTNSNQKLLEEISLFTVKRGIDDMYTDNINMKKIEESLSYTHYIPIVDNWNEIDSIIHEEIINALLGKKPSYEAIENAKIKINKLKNNLK